MATPLELLASMEIALERGRDAQSASVTAMSAALARVKATGVKVQTETTPTGVRGRFTDNPRSRAQVRLNPGDVASRAAAKAAQVGADAMEEAMGRS